MDFLYNVPANATTAGGLGKVHSRWLWSCVGRSDVVVTTTDSTLTYTLSECWGTSYLGIYKSVRQHAVRLAGYDQHWRCNWRDYEIAVAGRGRGRADLTADLTPNLPNQSTLLDADCWGLPIPCGHLFVSLAVRHHVQ